jgi:murein L,D-transpeptidase YafK
MPAVLIPHWRSLVAAAVGALFLAGCQESDIPKQHRPVPPSLSQKMRETNMSETGAVFIRIYKESSELEVWKEQRDGKYSLLKTYSVCKWSGELGPKIKEGDRQAPEGFYTVTPAQMNPKSSYYLSFNIGYPNAFDRSLGRTGSHLMVHGACSSSGCYSMTDEDAGELFALARDSFRGGQRAFQIQALPFRMTPENMAKHRDSPHFAFWQMLKEGSDHFELARVPPKIDICGKRYVFNADAGNRNFSPAAACPPYEIDPEIKTAFDAKQAEDETKFAAAVTRLTEEAARAAEEKRLAEERRVAEEAKAAAKVAKREARTEAITKKLGVFGRLLGVGDKEEGPQAAEAPAADTPVTAFAPAGPPKPPKPPKKPTAAPESTASITAPKTPVPPPPPTVAPPIAPEATTKTTITPEMTPAIPEVGKFVKKPFLWPEG